MFLFPFLSLSLPSLYPYRSARNVLACNPLPRKSVAAREAIRASKSEKRFCKLRFPSRGRGEMPRKVCKIGESESRYSRGSRGSWLCTSVPLQKTMKKMRFWLDSFCIQIAGPDVAHALFLRVITPFINNALRASILFLSVVLAKRAFSCDERKNYTMFD